MTRLDPEGARRLRMALDGPTPFRMPEKMSAMFRQDDVPWHPDEPRFLGVATIEGKVYRVEGFSHQPNLRTLILEFRTLREVPAGK